MIMFLYLLYTCCNGPGFLPLVIPRQWCLLLGSMPKPGLDCRLIQSFYRQVLQSTCYIQSYDFSTHA